MSDEKKKHTAVIPSVIKEYEQHFCWKRMKPPLSISQAFSFSSIFNKIWKYLCRNGSSSSNQKKDNDKKRTRLLLSMKMKEKLRQTYERMWNFTTLINFLLFKNTRFSFLRFVYWHGFLLRSNRWNIFSLFKRRVIFRQIFYSSTSFLFCESGVKVRDVKLQTNPFCCRSWTTGKYMKFFAVIFKVFYYEANIGTSMTINYSARAKEIAMKHESLAWNFTRHRSNEWLEIVW